MFQLGQTSPITEKARISPRSFSLIWLRRARSGCRIAISALFSFCYPSLFYCLLIVEHWIYFSSNLPQTVELKCLLPAKLKRHTNPWAFRNARCLGPLTTPSAPFRARPSSRRAFLVCTPDSQSWFCSVPCQENILWVFFCLVFKT